MKSIDYKVLAADNKFILRQVIDVPSTVPRLLYKDVVCYPRADQETLQRSSIFDELRRSEDVRADILDLVALYLGAPLPSLVFMIP